jgi:hypothetical protein
LRPRHLPIARVALLALLFSVAPARARVTVVPPSASPVHGAASSATERARIAARWAPTIYQETSSRADLLLAFDFDGDWDGSNNAAHLRDRTHRWPVRSVVYYAATETPTHWLLTYVLYHALDGKFISGHDHDTEHVTLVVRKDASPDGRLEAMETRFHKVMYQYAAPGVAIGKGADDVDGVIHLDERGRPEVYAQRVGHGICGGYAPPFFIDTLSLTCKHSQAPHFKRQGVVYRYTGVAAEARSLDDRDVGYALVDIGPTLWAHARQPGPHGTFASLMDFHGDRCDHFACPHGMGAVLAAGAGHGSTGMPWEEGGGKGVHGRGSAFLDPAYTLSRRLRFAPPFSSEYLYNPYRGVGRF